MKPTKLSKLFNEDDWKTEKHAPVIEVPNAIMKNDFFKVEVSVGKEVEHPNTVKHHIRWIELYFLPEGQKIPQHVGSFDFASHGEHGDGEEEGVFTHPCVATRIRIDEPGTMLASSYCNIHGLWQTARDIALES